MSKKKNLPKHFQYRNERGQLITKENLDNRLRDKYGFGIEMYESLKKEYKKTGSPDFKNMNQYIYGKTKIFVKEVNKKKSTLIQDKELLELLEVTKSKIILNGIELNNEAVAFYISKFFMAGEGLPFIYFYFNMQTSKNLIEINVDKDFFDNSTDSGEIVDRFKNKGVKKS